MATRLRSLYIKFSHPKNLFHNHFRRKSILGIITSFNFKMGYAHTSTTVSDSTDEGEKDRSKKYFQFSCAPNFNSKLLLATFMIMLFKRKEDNSQWQGEREVVHKIAMAEMALREGYYQKAEKILEDALQIATEKDVKVGIPCVYDMLATIAYKQGEINKAEKLLMEVIERMISAGVSETDNQIINFSMKLCRVYCNLQEDELAEIGFKNCVSVQKQKIVHGIEDDETGMLWISILFWYGKFLIARNRHDEARIYFDAAYAASAQVKSIMPAQIMVILYHLSEISMTKHDYDGALKHLLNAVILGRGTNNSDLPLYYVKIGIAYLHKGVYDQAKIWCTKGRKASKALRNKDAEVEANGCIDKLSQISFA